MRVLIVDDEPELATVLKSGLEEHGYTVDTAHDGLEGLEKSEGESYDLVVLDVMLPGLDGLTLCRKLRSGKNQVPVIMLTARDSLDDRVSGLDVGADDYLTKPFAFRELLARIRALLRRDALSRDTVLRAGDLELNTSSREVRRNGQLIPVTHKEYAVLEYFVRNPNKVLSRSQISERVWNDDFVAASNVVDVYIRYLRQKLGDSGHPALLRTIRGAGYQLSVNESAEG